MSNLKEINFVELLKKEYKQYHLLKEKAEEKREIIMENDIEKLASILMEEEKIINSINELEEDRHKYLESVAEKNNISTEKELSFEKFIKLLSPGEKEELKKLRNQFLDLLSDLEEINEGNRKLILDSLQINNRSLQIIRQATNKSKIYTKEGNEKPDSDFIIDRKV